MAKIMGFLKSLVVLATLASPALAQDTVTADTVVATVNGTAITIGHMIVLRDGLPDQYKSLPDDVLFKGILDQLIQQETLTQSIGNDISRQDKLTLDNQRRGYLSGVALEPIIASSVTDASLQAAYDKRFKDQAPATEYHAAHILVATEEEAKAIKLELDGGADFAELAKTKSTDTGSGQAGGDLGWFGTGAMVKPFEDAVIAAEVGKVTEPVKSNFGWHLILVQETRIADAPSLDDLRDELAPEIEQAAIDAKVAELSALATVTRSDEGIDPALINDLSLLGK